MLPCVPGAECEQCAFIIKSCLLCIQVELHVNMASPQEAGDDASSAVSSSDVVVAAADNDEAECYELLDNAHSDFLQHFENEIRISQPDSLSLANGGSSAGGTTVPDSSGVRSSTQLQQIADSNSSGLFHSDAAADVLSAADPYVMSNFVGAGTDMFVISPPPPLSSRIDGYVLFFFFCTVFVSPEFLKKKSCRCFSVKSMYHIWLWFASVQGTFRHI